MRLRSSNLILAFLAAFFLFLAASPAFRDSEGWITTAAWLPYTLALAFGVLALGLGTTYEVSSRWVALAALGQGAFLRLIEAGPMVSYQHLALPGRVGDPAYLPAVSVVFLQILVVSTLGRKTLFASLRWLQDRYSVLSLTFIAGLFILTSATLSAKVTSYISEVLFATTLQALNLFTVMAAVGSLPDDLTGRLTDRFSSLLGSSQAVKQAPRIDAFTLVGALWVMALSSTLVVLSYQQHPHVPDEYVYLLHARYFAAGSFQLPIPPVPAGFDIDLMTLDATRWYSPVPPGWPAVLALGVLVGAPWFVNPILGGVGVVLTSLVFQEVFDKRTARLGVVLLATSPWYVFMSMNLMTHTFSLVAALAGVVAVAAMIRTGRTRYAVPGGVAIGIVSLNRPLEGLVVAGALGLWVLVGSGRVVSKRLTQTSVLALSSALTGALTLPYNAHFTGKATYFPIMAYTDSVFGPGKNAMGFGSNRGWAWGGLDPFPGHGLLDVLVNGNLNLFSVNVELLGWSCGSLVLISLFLFSGRLRRQDWMMVLVIGLTIGLHSFYWFSGGPDFGARYWYLIIVPCVALAARGLVFLGQALAKPGKVLSAAAIFVSLAALLFVPWRAIDKYHHYRGMRPDIRQLAETEGFGDALVLVRGARHPDYASAAVYNPLDLSGPGPIYAWDKNPEVRQALLEAFRGRPVWRVDGPTLTGDGFQVIEGPVSADDLLERPTTPLGEGKGEETSDRSGS